jgi:DNA phosphorothioation-dependent restriction protein DptH
MDKFNEIIKEYVVNLCSDSFNEDEIEASRVLVKGMPFEIAKGFVTSVIEDGGLRVHDRLIPLVVFDQSVNSGVKPKSDLGGICGKDHVLNLRNSSSIDEIVVVLGEGSLLDKSGTTSLIPIGIDEDVQNEDWVQHEFIQHLVSKSLLNCGLISPSFTKQVNQVLSEFRSSESHQGDHTDQWKLLRAISLNVTKASQANLFETLGLINESDETKFDSARSLKVFNAIADAFENYGVHNSVREWLEKDLSIEVKEALEQFQVHYRSVCDSATAFRVSPYYYYGSLDTSYLNRNWWRVLTVEVWEDILGDEEEAQGSLKVEVTNNLFSNNKPCPIVLDEVVFKITPDTPFQRDTEVVVSHKKSGYEEIDRFQVPAGATETFWEVNPDQHSSYKFYRFQVDFYQDTTQKVISLANYRPGLVFDLSQLEKVTPLKYQADKRTDNQKWNSSVTLSNSGTHELRFYWDSDRFIFKMAKWMTKHLGRDSSLDLEPVLKSNNGSIGFEIEDAGTIELRFGHLDEGVDYIHRISLSVSETEPTGVKSVFEKLIRQNRSPKGKFERVEVYTGWSLLHQIQKWIVEDSEKSYYPLMLGIDFKSNFKRPDWSNDALVSKFDLSIDCRPGIESLVVPESILEIRKKVIQVISGSTDTDEETSSFLFLEQRDLFSVLIKDSLRDLILEYLIEYSKWFEDKPEHALWMDVLTFNNVQGDALENEPFAILLNPFHPIRLAWQFQCQEMLFEALDLGKPCPAAGILNASQFPDSLLLPCFKSPTQSARIPFTSVETDSTSWGLLWNGMQLSKLNEERLLTLFDSHFGMEIQGLDGGLSSSQVELTLSEIFKIKSGQNSVNVQVQSESSETNLFNLGVENWVTGNLGPDRLINNRKEVRDIWYSGGSRKLHLYDTREPRFQPSAEQLIDTTAESGYNLKWHSKSHDGKDDTLDLSILSHLANQSPILMNSDTSSVIFPGGVLRKRIRYSSMTSSGKLTFTESRSVRADNESSSKNQLGSALSKLLHLIEHEVQTSGHGHLTSTPRLNIVEDSLKLSDYCAVSSSAVDPSAFFDSDGQNYLWDYDLPSYSDRTSAKSGFYLMARRTEVVVSSVRKSLKTIPGMGNISNETVSKLLSEISGRGIPTLKTLASGGSSANGEIGMLAAMNVLQNFDSSDESFQFLPLRVGNVYNLLIPIDPFTNQLNSLSAGLGLDQQRPDLIALSFRFNPERRSVECVMITPIEIKYRNSPMIRSQLKSALAQCESFNRFYETLTSASEASGLWNAARCNLLSEIISFSFATYGRKISEHQESIEWSLIQEKLLTRVGQIDGIQLNTTGRLISISDYQNSEYDELGTTGVKEVLKLSFQDTKDLLIGQNLQRFEGLGSSDRHWGMICSDAPTSKTQEETKTDIIPESESSESESQKGNTKVSGSKTMKEEDADKSQQQIQESSVSMESESYPEGIKFEVGVHVGAISQKPYFFHPSNTKLNQLNIGIVGDLGTGKTQLIKALLHGISENPEANRGRSPKFLIMDTKRDYDGSGGKKSDELFVKGISAKVVKPYNLPINLFDIRNSKDDHPALTKAEFFIDILKKIFGGIGPNQEDNILTAAYHQGCI